MANSGFSDIDMMALNQRMASMTGEELLAAMDEIALLDLPASIRENVEGLVIYPLSRKYPDLAVKGLTGRDVGGSSEGQLENAFGTWAKKDTAGARTWLDAQVSAGTFDPKTLDGKNWLWIKYEAGLIRSLLLQEGDALEARFDQFPADLHKDLLHSLGMAWKPQGAFEPGEEEVFCKLVRGHLSTEEQAELFALRADQVGWGGFAAVDRFLTTIQATPDERFRCIQKMAISNIATIAVNATVRREDIEVLRDWMATQKPAEVDRFTGDALGYAAGHKGIAATKYRKLGYGEAAAFALEFDAAGGSDRVLVSFLKSEGGRSDKNQARALAARIKDETLRAEILNTLN
ncbi:MAG: hypothetical protein EOP87_08915 [Verrucomicrobiaceae bacterium]|nr:MAG: hypothetical protein EOP87_08915 [Verrucomicrobiaceae bacterium]